MVQPAPLLRAVLLLVAAAALLSAGPAGAGLSAEERLRVQRSGRVGVAVLDALDQRARVRVMVALAARAGSRRAIEAAGDRVLGRLPLGAFERPRRFRSVGALSGSVTPAGLMRLLESADVLRVDLDRPAVLHLAEAVPLVNQDVLHATGYTGQGVQVAVIDTGVDLAHADLAGAVIAEHCFCTTAGGGCCLDDSTSQSGAGSALDEMGHGTWVTGVVTSDGVIAPTGGAPDAQIVAVKMAGEVELGLNSDIVAGLDWILNERPDVDVVNLSVGTSQHYEGVCDAADAVTLSYAAVIDALRASGVLVVSATGNSGFGTQIPAPACIDSTLAVGATWDDTFASQTVFGCTDAPATIDTVPCWSSSNEQTDLLAPGARITTVRRLGLTQTVRGTSFSSPLAASCAALLLEADPTLTPDELEAALETSPVLATDDTNGLSFPRLDCEAALNRALPPIPALGHVARVALALLLASAVVLRRARAQGRSG